MDTTQMAREALGSQLGGMDGLGTQGGIHVDTVRNLIDGHNEVPPQGYEKLFDGLGLLTPSSRVLGAAAITAAVMHLVKPSMSFHEDGSAKSIDEGGLPWWSVPVAVGVVVHFTT